MSIPQYAQNTPRHKLVNIVCRGSCGRPRYAEVSKVPWTEEGPNDDPELYATCLKCGYEAKDSYNWVRV